MKILTIILAATALAISRMTANFAQAAEKQLNPALTAADGSKINISWNSNVTFDPQSGEDTEIAQNVRIRVDTGNDNSGSQAVFIENCTRTDGSGYQNTLKCDLQRDDSSSYTSSCQISGDIMIEQSYEGNADRTICAQQLAVVLRDNTWLVDPVSRQHNFNFRLSQ